MERDISATAKDILEKFRVVGVDCDSNQAWIAAEFDDPDEASDYVKTKTTLAAQNPNFQGFRWDPSQHKVVRFSGASVHFYTCTPDSLPLQEFPKNLKHQ